MPSFFPASGKLSRKNRSVAPAPGVPGELATRAATIAASQSTESKNEKESSDGLTQLFKVAHPHAAPRTSTSDKLPVDERVVPRQSGVREDLARQSESRAQAPLDKPSPQVLTPSQNSPRQLLSRAIDKSGLRTRTDEIYSSDKSRPPQSMRRERSRSHSATFTRSGDFTADNLPDPRCESLEEQVRRLKVEKESWEREKIRFNAKVQSIGEENDTLKDKCRELEDNRDWHSEERDKLQKEFDGKTDLLDAALKANEELFERKRAADDEITRLIENLKDCQLDLEDEKADHEKTKRDNVENADLLLKYTSEETTSADDTFFASEWRKMRDRIFGWSQNFFRGEVLDPHALEISKNSGNHHFNLIATDPGRYIASNFERPYFVQSFLWSVLVHNVFAYPGQSRRTDVAGLLWSQHLRSQLDRLSGDLCPDFSPHANTPDEKIARYMKWRSATARLILGRLNSDPSQKVQVYVEDLQLLEDYVLGLVKPMRCTKDPNDPKAPTLRGELREIFIQAIHLDSKLHLQWALVVPRNNQNGPSQRYDHGFRFEPLLMENGDNKQEYDETLAVEIVLTPALVRFGTMDGDEYKSQTVVQKGQVYLQRPSASRRKGFIRDKTWEKSPRETEYPFNGDDDVDDDEDSKGGKRGFWKRKKEGLRQMTNISSMK